MKSDDQSTDNPFDGLSFAPSWAKSSSEEAGESLRRRAEKWETAREERFERHDRRDRPSRRDGDFRDRPPRRDGDFRDRPPRRDGDFRDRPPRRDGDFRDRPPRRDGDFRDRPPRRDGDFRDRPPRRDGDFRHDGGAQRWRRDGRPDAERVPPPFSVRFLPDQAALSFLARKIAVSRKAMPLRDVVELFYKTPDTTLARLEFDEAHKDEKFHQCTECGWFARTEDDLRRHILAEHFPKAYRAVEVEVEPPGGSYSSVARCGVTGKWLAPPNHHSYSRCIDEMLRDPACAGMSEAEYRSRIELVAGEEAVAAWRAQASHKTLFEKIKQDAKPNAPAPAKPAPDAPATAETPAPEAPASEEAPAQEAAEAPAPEAAETPAPGAAEAPAPEAAEAPAPETPERLSREEAEARFLAESLPRMVRHSRQVTIGHEVSTKLADAQALAAIRRAWDHEQRIPVSSLFFAVRAGLKARKLALFRASDEHREEFVSFRAPTAIDTSLAVPELREILEWSAANPGGTRKQLLEALTPKGTAPEKAEAVRSQLAFALDRGALIEYSNGVLAVGQEHPFWTAEPASPAPAPAATEAPPPADPPPAEPPAESAPAGQPAGEPEPEPPVADAEQQEAPASTDTPLS